ncbi:hypothetical protein BSLG_010456 [Batrachochytrium salamandrivorans]|nr:hypothetical protein BSLG_010456 [Batrachochytrium salamandrivorans]
MNPVNLHYEPQRSTKLELFCPTIKTERHSHLSLFKSDEMGSNTILNPYRPSQARRKSTSTPVLPKLGTGPLNLQFSNSPAVIPSAGIESTLLDPQESIHSFVQHTWAKFASMPDAHRNMLLKGSLATALQSKLK